MYIISIMSIFIKPIYEVLPWIFIFVFVFDIIDDANHYIKIS